MDTVLETLTVNGKNYVLADSLKKESAEKLDGLPCVIVRTYSAGVVYGYLKSRIGKEVVLLKSRKIFNWSGALEVTHIAVEGVLSGKISVPCETESVYTEAIEIHELTKTAKEKLDGIVSWKK